MIKQIIILLLFTVILCFGQKNSIEEFTVEQSINSAAKIPGEKSELTFTIFSEENELYKVSRNIEYDEPFPSVDVFDDGSAAVYYSFDGRIEFFDNAGNLVEELKLYKEPEADYERSIITSVSNKILTLLIADSNSENCEVVIFNNQGHLLNRFFVTGKFISGIMLSEEKDLIAVSTYKWNDDSLIDEINLHSLDGEIIRSLPGQFNDAKIIENVLIGFTNKKYFTVELDDFSIFNYEHKDESEIILDVTLNAGSVYTAYSNNPELVNGEWIYNHVRIEMVNSNSQIKKLIDLPSGNFVEFSFLNIEDYVEASIDKKLFRID